MTVSAAITEWGRRLTDAIRVALDAGDVARARRLAVDGDGQARSLAKEYSLMYRGLGITIRVMLPLLRDAAARVPEPERAAAADELARLLYRFCADMTTLGAATSRPQAGTATSDAPGTVDDEIARTARLLDDSEERFERQQTDTANAFVRALDSGDRKAARALLETKEREQYVPRHDRLVRFLAETFGWVLRRSGPDGLLRFHLGTAEGQRRGFEKWDQLPADEFAWATTFLLKQHMGEVEVSEDDERFTLEQRVCGSGGRLRLGGAYEGPDALPFVEEPGPLTFGQPRLPVYCSHCPVWNTVAALRWFGRPHWIFERASRPDGSCTLHVYKRRDGAPREYVALFAGAAGE